VNKRLFRIFAAAASIALGFWGWKHFFPNPEQVIRRRLKDLSLAASSTANQTPFASLYNAQKLAAFFTSDVEIKVDVPGHSQQTLSGRDQLVPAAVSSWNAAGGLQVEFLDIAVSLAPDKQSATVSLTGKGRIAGDPDFLVQELKFVFQKTDDGWLIQRVETVKTLR